MKSQIYALSVGIDAYAPDVGALAGCVNDVDRFQSWLRSTFSDGQLRSEVLKNGDATRDNIIRLFRSHLGKATEHDTIVFQYCGHGAQSKSAPEFMKFFPGGKDEGLVCFDSRSPGGYDLADKELAVLLAEAAQQQPHVAVILDCCHSGSGTRSADAFDGLVARQTHEILEQRPLDSYLDGHYSALEQQGDTLRLPASRHVLLAACERFEKAYEGSDKHGVFSTALVTALDQAGSSLSYADLFLRCRAMVKNSVDNQTPQFETYNGFSAYSGFLGSRSTQAVKRYDVEFRDNDWQVACGALHGMPVQPQAAIELMLYDEDEPDVSLPATTRSVGAQRSALVMSEQIVDTSRRFSAEITSMPMPPMPVALVGAQLQQAAVLSTILTAAAEAPDIALMRDGQSGDHFALSAEDDGLKIRTNAQSDLVHGVAGVSEQSAQYIVSALQRIHSWQRVNDLKNAHSRIDPTAISFSFRQLLGDGDVHDHDASELILDLRLDGGDAGIVRGKLLGQNHSEQVLHFMLLYLSEDYGVTVLYNERIEPSGQPFEILMDGDPVVDFSLDDSEGNSALHHFKLMVTTEKADDFVFDQAPLQKGEVVELTDRGASFGAARKKLAASNDWMTKDLRIHIVRQVGAVQPDDVELCNGALVVKGHPSLQAGISLRSIDAGTRSTGGDAIIRRFLERSGMQAVDFTSSRGGASQALELTNIRNADSLKTTPLELTLQTMRNDDEFVLPVVFDGEHLMLVGNPSVNASGDVHVSINELPDILDNKRSLGKAIKLYFLRTWLKRESVNKLCWVEYLADGSIARRSDGIGDKVADARNIILLVHGIIGDTEVIANGLTTALDDETSLKSSFDLVLSFDYENLNTPIEATALELKQQLHAIGLQNDDDRNLTILAHSMGGLVSRWMIEKEGGHTLVDHLIMCGTPNRGSPFGKIDDARKVTSMLTGLAVNFFTPLAAFGGALLYALNRSKDLTQCLEQMDPESTFMASLNSSDDPEVRYTIISGDVRSYSEASDSRSARLIAKLGGSIIFDALYQQAAHDIAVSDRSIRGVPTDRSPKPQEQIVQGHHLNYFLNDGALKAIEEAIEAERRQHD